VVDNDRHIIEMLPSLLTQYGYRTVAFDNAEKALRALQEGAHGVDVVLTDVRMPDVSGIELLELIHRFNPQLPVILMTAYADLETIEVAIRKKAFDFITKPLNFAELAMTMEKAIKHVTLLELEQNYLHTLEETVEIRTRELHSRHEELKTLFRQVEAIKAEWERTMDCIGDIVILADTDGRIRRCNRALREFSAISYQDIVGNEWRSFLARHGLHAPSPSPPGTELYHEPSSRWFILNSYPFTDPADEAVSGLVITIVDTSELKRTAEKLAHAYEELHVTQAQMLQREKMASIGQLAAGVAHEINNPIGFISSNLATLGKYVERLTAFVSRQTEVCTPLMTAAMSSELEETRRELKIDHILADISPLIAESLDGAGRVRTIVRDLKSFSRSDEGEYKTADIVACLDSAVSIVWNELKYKATLRKNYGALPPVKCYPQQLNQVLMNLLVNAAHAIDKQGEITIDTRHENGEVFIVISDTGCGIPPENLGRIFEPFFTTKESGKGTGLGLSISYDIVKRHHGEITVESTLGKGTTFTVRIPVT
jgi:two-component system NtrC family sensor kinase